MPRNLSTIAEEIIADWTAGGKPVSPTAAPYLNAMRSLSTVDDYYGMDSGKSLVRYFLANASTWKGEIARRIKLELKGMVD